MNNITQQLEKAISIAKGQKKLAALIEQKTGAACSQQSISKWLTGVVNPIPLDRAFQIQIATEGAVKVEDLRPDIFPRPIKSRLKLDIKSTNPKQPRIKAPKTMKEA